MSDFVGLAKSRSFRAVKLCQLPNDIV